MKHSDGSSEQWGVIESDLVPIPVYRTKVEATSALHWHEIVHRVPPKNWIRRMVPSLGEWTQISEGSSANYYIILSEKSSKNIPLATLVWGASVGLRIRLEGMSAPRRTKKKKVGSDRFVSPGGPPRHFHLLDSGGDTIVGYYHGPATCSQGNRKKNRSRGTRRNPASRNPGVAENKETVRKGSLAQSGSEPQQQAEADHGELEEGGGVAPEQTDFWRDAQIPAGAHQFWDPWKTPTSSLLHQETTTDFWSVPPQDAASSLPQKTGRKRNPEKKRRPEQDMHPVPGGKRVRLVSKPVAAKQTIMNPQEAWPLGRLVPLGLYERAHRPTYISKADVRMVIISSGQEKDSDDLREYLLDRWRPVWGDVIQLWRMSKTMRGSGAVGDTYFYPPGVKYSDRIRSKRRLRWLLEHMVQNGLRDYNTAIAALTTEAEACPIGPVCQYLPTGSPYAQTRKVL